MTGERSSLASLLRAAVADLERDIDTLDDLLALGEGHDLKVRLLAFAGYRNASEARISGRVVRFSKPLDAGEGMMQRLRAMIAIYNSAELAGIEVRCEAYGQTVDTLSDEEGYFSFNLPLDRPLPERTTWESATLCTPGREAQQENMAVPVIAPGNDNHWAVISDIDDTVVETGATNFVRNWRRVLIERPHERLAVPGAASLYRIIAGNHAEPVRPFFYVSSSLWNLYGFIAEFMELNSIPHGPMFLKDYGVDEDKLIKPGHATHKLQAIKTVLAFYPNLRFLLIGDNGQEDVDIYARAARDFPDRIRAVFIRDVAGECAEGGKAELLAGIRGIGIPTYCGATFDEAVEIARSLDLERPAEAARAAAQPA